MVSELKTLRAENVALKAKLARIQRIVDYPDDGCEHWFWTKLAAALR